MKSFRRWRQRLTGAQVNCAPTHRLSKNRKKHKEEPAILNMAGIIIEAHIYSLIKSQAFLYPCSHDFLRYT